MTTAIEDRIIEVGGRGKITAQIKVPDGLALLPDGEKPRKGFGVFRVMSPKDGDKRVVWDCRDLDQIEDAKEMFDDCVAQGLVPYRVGINGNATSDVMDEFDPYAEEVLFLPIQLVGGG